MSYHYNNDLRYVEDEVKSNFWVVIKIGALLCILLTLLGWVGCFASLVGGGATDAARVIKQEVYPAALLKKYEWFKDASAQLDKKQADIKVYDVRFQLLADAYEGVPRSKWPRDDREQYAIWASELAGIKASYNSLAAEYNSQMSKINWAFTNVGQLPPGATNPLPREYKPYEEK